MPVDCPTCGITFAVPRPFYDERVADQRAFTCPNACAVRLGTESSSDRQVQSLGKQVVELGEALKEARTIVDELARIALDRESEIGILRQAVVQYELGPATAQEER